MLPLESRRQRLHKGAEILLGRRFCLPQPRDLIAQLFDACFLVGQLLHVLQVQRAVPIELRHVLPDPLLFGVDRLELLIQRGPLRLEVRDPLPVDYELLEAPAQPLG